MAHQVPGSRVAERGNFAGPFLRFQSGTGPDDGREWRGSVLCCTRAANPAAAASAAAAPTAARTRAAGGDTNGGDIAAAWPGAAAAEPARPPAAAGSDGAAPSPTVVIEEASGAGGEDRLTAVQLDECEGWVMWRFDLALQLTDYQRPVKYRVEAGGWGGRCGREGWAGPGCAAE